MPSPTCMLGLFAGVALCVPRSQTALTIRGGVEAVPAIEQIMPTSTSCVNVDFPDECRTASEAAGYIIAAFQTYGTDTSGEMAALLSLMGYESVDMKYKHNVDPGRPGQGTANMQMANYNLQYAQQLGLSPDENNPNGTLSLVMDDEYNFGSASWYLTTQSECASARKKLRQDGNTAAFTAYMSCVGTSATSDRLAYWTRAQQVFGLPA